MYRTYSKGTINHMLHQCIYGYWKLNNITLYLLYMNIKYRFIMRDIPFFVFLFFSILAITENICVHVT